MKYAIIWTALRRLLAALIADEAFFLDLRRGIHQFIHADNAQDARRGVQRMIGAIDRHVGREATSDSAPRALQERINGGD